MQAKPKLYSLTFVRGVQFRFFVFLIHLLIPEKRNQVDYLTLRVYFIKNFIFYLGLLLVWQAKPKLLKI
jgi:hypothetical protein